MWKKWKNIAKGLHSPKMLGLDRQFLNMTKLHVPNQQPVVIANKKGESAILKVD